MPSLESGLSGLWIIGYGNPQRRDDGVGAWVVDRLRPNLEHRPDIHLWIQHQLVPDMIDTLKAARTIVFVDATTETLERGWNWTAPQPEFTALPYLAHHFSPAFILWLLLRVYDQTPEAWMVSVAGNDFSFGNGLSQRASRRAARAASEIEAFALAHSRRQASATPKGFEEHFWRPQ